MASTMTTTTMTTTTTTTTLSCRFGPLRSALEWPNLSAHADQHPVTLFYMQAGDPESAAYIQEWDVWREGGCKVVPCYGDFEQARVCTSSPIHPPRTVKAAPAFD